MKTIRRLAERDSNWAAVPLLTAFLSLVVGGWSLWTVLHGGPGPAADIMKSQPQRFVGARGERLPLKLTGTSLAGLWASRTGFALRIAGQDVPLVRPRAKKWSDDISYSNHTDHEIEIGASFVVPDVPGPERLTLSGAIVGKVEYPESAGRRRFRNAYHSLDIPVTLDVVPAAEASAARARERGGARLAMWVALGVFIPAGGFTALYAREEARVARAKKQVAAR